MNHSSNIDYDLLAKYISGNTNTEETVLVEEWITASEENRQEMEALKSIWQLAPPAPAEASQLNIDAAWSKLHQRMQTLDQQKKEKDIPAVTGKVRYMNPWVLRIAAIFIIGLAIWGAIRFLFPSDPELLAFTTAESTQEITLPDGSIVTLNKYSTIQYPEEFTGNRRDVQLTGEAFFVVAENAAKPFVVNTGSAKVKVLGTQFNVSAYDTTADVSVAVVEGKVLLYKEDNKGYVAESVTLTKGETGVFTKVSGEIKELEAEPDAIYWMSKTIIFERTELSKVFEVLNKLFATNIAAGNTEINNCRLSATFRDESLENILSVIATTFSLEVNQENGTYKLTGEGCLVQ